MAGGAASQQLHPSDRSLNRRVTSVVDASSSVSVARLSCKSVCCILDSKNWPIDDERILDASLDFVE